MKKALLFCLPFLSLFSVVAQQPKLTVDYIMRDPKWMGIQPDNVQWLPGSKSVVFDWKADKEKGKYAADASTGKVHRLALDEEKSIPANDGIFNQKHTQYLYEKNNDIFLLDVKSGKEKALIQTTEREQNPAFFAGEKSITFTRGDNLFSYSLADGSIKQLSNFVKTKKKAESEPKTEQDRWLKADQKNFVVLARRDSVKKAAEKKDKSLEPILPKEIVTGDKAINGVQLSPDGKYITYRLIQFPEGNHTANVPNYVTPTGYTEDIPARTKVGSALPKSESFIYDIGRDTFYAVSTKEIPGIKDLPDYVKDYPKQLAERQKKNADRAVIVHGPFWNQSGTMAVVVVGAQDNKDRWMMRLDASTGKLTQLDRQRDEAWIGGPGIGGSFSAGRVGWLYNNRFYFQSEASGYSHIYSVDVKTGAKKALTSGHWEVQTLQLSNDKKSFYFTANMEHPGITHFYKMPVDGGKPTKLTSMKGGNETSLSPDEKWLAIRYSYSNKPWELYIQPNKASAKARKITTSTTAEFNSYPWREPEMITYKNRSGNDIYARLYRPKNADAKKPAVIFVHGAGYLQNVHYWWSQYFREYMFHNLLADNGYTVLDVDYTASAGYGRNHRTGIYRHMGGKDLDDQLDGAKLLVDKYGVDPKRIGIYGGSYGGFITLMALFTQPDIFAAGVGLRSVTDWAHYNQGYTANILNAPFEDEKAYRQSSPIYFAAGLKNRLLMCHGMVDVNVHYQDIVRLGQRLIELKKDNWELASYPVEDHGFVEPESWTDEYKRIFKLFEETLKR